MYTITTTVFTKVGNYFRKAYWKLIQSGTSNVTDEDEKNRIVLVNILALAIGVIILSIAPFVIHFFSWNLMILAAIAIEFTVNCSVLALNHYKRHLLASLTLFFLQCFAIIYFGYLLGQVLQLQFMIIFLISITYLIFKDNKLRKLCFGAAIFTLIMLELCYYHNSTIQPIIPISNNTAFIIQSLAIAGVLFLIIIVSKPYVRSNDIKQELEKANHFKKMFVYQVTHEMRTPLNAIYGVAQLLKREIKLDENLKPIEILTDQLLAASNNTRNIINNVLDMAEIETGKMESAVEDAFPVRAFFEKMIDVNKIVARARNIQLKLFIDQMPEVLIGDTLKLNQVVTNLLANAIKFADKNTIILLKVTGLEGRWRMQVINQGATISPQRINVIFDPFITMKSRSTEGTGLGLYIVKNKVLSMQGTIEIESLGEGLTTFTVTLPLRVGNREDVPVEEMEEDIKDLSNIHVMIAEDDEMNAKLLTSFLKHIGCKVTYTINGLELLQKVEKEIPDVIILDSYMPVMNGEETLNYLRNAPELKNIPVIVATGDAFKESREAFIKAGANAFIEKPIDHRALVKVLKLYLHHNNEELQE